jgi:RNA polymerase sigma factor (TIGR02999 family)
MNEDALPARQSFASTSQWSYRRPAMNSTDDSVTQLLDRWYEGDRSALDRLLPMVYADLRRIARGMLHATPGHATLQTTALVHDVLLRLLDREPAYFQDSAHLINASARMMRQVLVDRARRSASIKRGGQWVRDDFTAALELPIPDQTDLAELDAALNELEAVHERMARVVELRYFVGLEVEEIAGALGIHERTARRDWVAAREWLRDRLDQPT